MTTQIDKFNTETEALDQAEADRLGVSVDEMLQKWAQVLHNEGQVCRDARGQLVTIPTA